MAELMVEIKDELLVDVSAGMLDMTLVEKMAALKV